MRGVLKGSRRLECRLARSVRSYKVWYSCLALTGRLTDYITNEQETQRNPETNEDGQTIEAVSSNLDDQTMHEVYLWPFQDAVKSGVASFMCSYNRINGSYGCANSKTQNGILKTELGFQGYVSLGCA